jgi:peptidoglycan/xylan/chitin deacetylase (PgdA/CDA1 family)
VPEPGGGVAATFARNAVGALRGRRPPFVLCYHGLGDADPAGDPHGLMLSPAAFGAQLDALLDAGYRLVTAAELWSAVERGGPRAARGLGAVTFDDGLRETMALATEMLRARGATGTAYIPSALLGREHPDLAGHQIVTADEVRTMAAEGIEVGAHSATHLDLAAADPALAERELHESRAVLTELLGAPVPGVAYPFGRYTPETIAAARRAGYAYACACAGAGPWRAFEIPREPVFPSTSPRRLRVKALGLYGPVHALQRRRGSATA